LPWVSVPVLSVINTSTLSIISKTWAFLINIPDCAPFLWCHFYLILNEIKVSLSRNGLDFNKPLIPLQLKNRLWTTVVLFHCCTLIWDLTNNYSLYLLQFMTVSVNIHSCYISILDKKYQSDLEADR
jgi:hypothetical protein